MTTVDNLIDSRLRMDQVGPANQDAVIKINDFISMSQGLSNAYMVETSDSRVIINTGMGFEALVHKKIFDAECSKPTSHILLTQGHVDHVGGVGQFREDKTVLIAQENNAECQRDDERIRNIRQSQSYIWFQKTIDAAIACAKDNPEALIQDVPIADKTFKAQYSFFQGGIEFELYATPGGETIDSCVVWLPQFEILFSGNVFGPLFPHFPNINTIRGDKYRYIEPYLESLALVKKLQPQMLITGHFEPIEGKQLIQDCLQRLQGAVDYVHRETLKGMNEGTDIYTLMKTVQLPDEHRVGQGYGKVTWAVRTIWESYMGWFKALRSSELYPVQANEVYSDLVELAGVSSVLHKAQQFLQEKQTEKALHLCEAVLQAEPENVEAIELAIAVHQALLSDKTENNFWLDGWLNQQIKELKSKL